jgi:hypothetical protein
VRAAAALAAVLILAATAAGVARADGDPASDVLPTGDVYLPLSSPSADAAAALTKSIADVFAGGDRLKVAVIATTDDMGSVPSLFNQPDEYARFLSAELSGFYVGPLLIAMPGGFGFYDGGRSTSAASTVLSNLSPNKSTIDAYVRSVAAAVDKLRSAGALHSPDVKAPVAYPGLNSGVRGKTTKLTFRVFDDSERASAKLTITGSGKTLANLSVPLQQAVYAKTMSVNWRVPKTIAQEVRINLRLCIVATDAAGNHSKRSCLPIKVR